MWNLLTGLWYGFVNFLSILAPFAREAPSPKMSPAVRWALHILLLILILVGLFFLNRLVRDDVTVPAVRHFFLPLIFILVYLALWTAIWIWRLLMAEPGPSSFPDIDAAWAEAIRALAEQGIRLQDLPLFLVLGRPEAGEDHLFHAAAGLPLVVKQTPAGPQQPLHVYASREAIYLSCPGASLLGKHASNLALEGIEAVGGGGLDGESESPEEQRTIRPTGKEKKVIKQLVHIGSRQMNVVERRAARRDLGLPMPNLLKNTVQVETLLARLAHLGRLIVRERQPFCPINGILVLLPLGGTDTDLDAQQTADLCDRDLATLRKVLQLRCPILTLVCDLEALSGFSDFVQRVTPKDRLGRLGQRFPLAPPDLAGEPLVEHIDQSIHHLCDSYLRDWVYRLFTIADGEDNQAADTNTGIYLFLDEMRGRKSKLSRILTNGIARDAPVPLLYAGCYLAGTGADRDREQAFVAGVFKRLLENQNVVSWTDEALAHDRRSQRRASLGYAALAALGLAVVGALGYYFFGPRRP